MLHGTAARTLSTSTPSRIVSPASSSKNRITSGRPIPAYVACSSSSILYWLARYKNGRPSRAVSMASVLRPNSALRNVHTFSHRASSRPTLYNASAAIASSAQTFQPSNLNWQCSKSRQSLRCFTTCSARQRRSSVFGAAVSSSVASALDSSFSKARFISSPPFPIAFSRLSMRHAGGTALCAGADL